MIVSILYAASIFAQTLAPQAKTELVASVTSVIPGKKFTMAVKMQMAPGWHSYYSNPGESGQATGIKWILPRGFKAGPIRWPTPKRILINGVASYVYENEVWLLTDISAKDWAGDSQRSPLIAADVSWLLCRDACFPQHSHLSWVVDVGSGAPNPKFAPPRESITRPLLRVSPKAIINNKTVVLSAPGIAEYANGLEFYPADATYFGADLPTISQSASGAKVTIPISKYAPSLPKRLVGILVIPSGPEKGSHWIDLRLGVL